MSKIPIILCHGWGFDDRFWSPIIHMFEKDRVYNLNLEYFKGRRNDEIVETKNNYIGIAHSLGMIKLISLFGARLTHLIGINSFTDFLGKKDELHKKRSITLETMIRKFIKNPGHTLMRFQNSVLSSTVSENQQLPEGSPDFSTLLSDLEKLKLNKCTPKIPTLIIGSMDDKIVPVELIHDNFPEQKKVIFEIGGHNTIGKIPSLVYKEIEIFLNLHGVLR